MLDWYTCKAVERNQDIVSGAWVFRGTRVLVTALFEHLEGGATVDQFLEWFPGVTRDQVDVVLEHTARSLHAALGYPGRRYEADNGPLVENQYREIAKRVPQTGFTSTRKRLY